VFSSPHCCGQGNARWWMLLNPAKPALSQPECERLQQCSGANNGCAGLGLCVGPSCAQCVTHKSAQNSTDGLRMLHGATPAGMTAEQQHMTDAETDGARLSAHCCSG
jgi:hypothetical protein